MKLDDIKRFDLVDIGDSTYIVLNIISYHDNSYFYLINENENEDDVSLVKVNEESDGLLFSPIEDDNEFAEVMNLLLLDGTKLMQNNLEEA